MEGQVLQKEGGQALQKNGGQALQSATITADKKNSGQGYILHNLRWAGFSETKIGLEMTGCSPRSGHDNRLKWLEKRYKRNPRRGL